MAVASYNAAEFLCSAVESALAQTLCAVEVIVVDDGSRDASLAIAGALAERDPRVRVLATPRNVGPGGARNIALAEARGMWFAVLDADDLMCPNRLSRLIALGEAEDADIVADDLVVFDYDGTAAPRLFIDGSSAGWIGLADYLETTVIYGGSPDLGFLKPVIRTDRLRAAGLRYDEALRVAEDDDLIVRMLVAGFRYKLADFAGYLYRRHGGSISHRLSSAHAAAMCRASAARLDSVANGDQRVRSALDRRHRAMRGAEAFARWIEAAKARRLGLILAIPLVEPGMLPLLRMPVSAAWKRLTNRGEAGPTRNLSPSEAVAEALTFASGSGEEASSRPPTRVDVCICTFRRPSLSETLASVASQCLPEGTSVRILVADNDDAPDRRSAIVAEGAALGLDLVYLHAPVANIAVARNACLTAATAPWIAFIDDDEIAAPDWIARLLAGRGKANVVFGVSQARYSDPAIPNWVRRGDFHSNRIAGNDAPWNGYTANVLIDRAFAARHGIGFDPAFGQTGGEDTDFFHRLSRVGAQFGYCPHAVVFEETPPSRARLGWLLRRRYRAGQIHQRLNGGGAGHRLALTAIAAIKAAALLAAAPFASSRERAISRLLRGSLHVGVVGGGVGLGHYREYAPAPFPR